MVALPPRAMSVGQDEHAKSMIRLLKQYRSETKNNEARLAIAKAVLDLAGQLVAMPDAGGRWPAPQCSRPGSNPTPPEGSRPPPPANPPPGKP